MANMMFTMPNSADTPAVLQAGSSAGGYPVTNLQTRQLNQPWRSLATDWPYGAIQATLGPMLNSIGSTFTGPVWPSSRWLGWQQPLNAVDTYVAAFMLHAHNARPTPLTLTAGNYAQWRVRAYTSLSSQFPVLSSIVRPALLLSPTLTNLSGSLGGTMSNPWPAFVPATSWLTATSPGSNTSGLFSFNPAQYTDGGLLPLKAGANLQTFIVQCRRTSAGSGVPTLEIDLYEGGSFVANLGSGINIPSSTLGPLVIVQWNASLLSSLTSQHVQIKVTGTANSGSSVEFGAVEFLAEHNGYAVDSGAIQVLYPNLILSQNRNTPLLYVPPAAVNLPTTQTGFIPTALSSAVFDQLFTLDSYSQASRMIVADAVSPYINMDYDWSVGWQDPSVLTKAVAGNIWADVRPKNRLGEFVCKSLQLTEAYDQIFSQLQGTVGITGDFAWIPDPANTAEYYNQVLYAHFQDLSPVVNPRFVRYSQSYKVEELL